MGDHVRKNGETAKGERKSDKNTGLMKLLYTILLIAVGIASFFGQSWINSTDTAIAETKGDVYRNSVDIGKLQTSVESIKKDTGNIYMEQRTIANDIKKILEKL